MITKVHATYIANAFSRCWSCVVLQLHEPTLLMIWKINWSCNGACSGRPLLAPKPSKPRRASQLKVLSGLAPSAFLARIYAPMSQGKSGCNQRRQRSIWRAWRGPKHKAADISRTQYEVYLFSTKYNLSEATVDELLEMLSNVCTSFDQSRWKAGPATCEFEWSSEYDLYCKLLLLINLPLLHIITWPVITCNYCSCNYTVITTLLHIMYYYKFCYYTGIASSLHIIASFIITYYYCICYYTIITSLLCIITCLS